jgi:hypothetical protein
MCSCPLRRHRPPLQSNPAFLTFHLPRYQALQLLHRLMVGDRERSLAAAFGGLVLGRGTSGSEALMAHFLCPRLPPHEHAEVEQLLKVRRLSVDGR